MYKPPKKLFKGKSESYYTNFTIGGNRVRRSLKTNIKAEAERKSLELYNKLNEKVQNPKSRDQKTVEEVFAKFLVEEVPHRKDKKDVKNRIVRFASEFGRSTPWADIDDPTISDYITRRREEFVPKTLGKKPEEGQSTIIGYTNRKITPATINRELALLSKINTLCINKWKIEPADVNFKVHKLEEKPKKKRSLTPEEERCIYNELPPYWQNAFKFLMYTGLRSEAILAYKTKDRLLRKKNFNLVDKTITLHVKRDKVHIIPITESCYKFLVEKIDIHSLDNEDFLFTYPKEHRLKGRPLGDPRSALHSAMKRAGFQREFFEGMHLLRHTVATRIANELGPLEAQQMLGHSDIKTTMGYVHTSILHKVDKIDKILNNRSEDDNN